MNISPTPTDEEAAAISAALTFAWPQPQAYTATVAKPPSAWRFSGRWWSGTTGWGIGAR